MPSDDRLNQLREWFTQFYEAITDTICRDFVILDFETAQHRLLADLPNCQAATSRQFLDWAKKKIKLYANEEKIFEHADRLTLQDVLTLASARSERKGTKPLIYEVHGEKAFIKLEDSHDDVFPWIVPASWLPVARALWPCHVRRNKTGPYVNKKVAKQRLNGTWFQFNLPVHRLFANCETGDTVDAFDGNFLNFSDDNLIVHRSAPETRESREVSLSSLPEELSANWKPAKPRRTPTREGTATRQPYGNEHERKVWAWLHGLTP